MKIFFRLFCLFLFLTSCKEESKNNSFSKEIKANSSEVSQNKNIPNNFKSHLFIVGPNIDDVGNLELGCDCCSSEFYFCDDTNFIEVSYCLEGDDVLTGKYKLVEDGLEFQYNKKRLYLESNWETEIDSLKDKVTYSEMDNEFRNKKMHWKKEKDSRFYQTSGFDFAEKQDSLLAKHIKWLSEDSKVYNYLQKNIKSLNF